MSKDKLTQLNKNSWHWKFNEFIYGKHTNEVYYFDNSKRIYKPKHNNLCPYFWKLFFGFMFLPFVLFGKSLILIGKGIIWIALQFPPVNLPSMPHINLPEVHAPELSWQREHQIRQLIWWGLIALAVIGIVVGSVSYQHEMLLIGGMIGILAGIIAGILVLLNIIDDYRRNQPHKYKERKPNILKEMMKAWYHKNCPQIEWK